MREMSTIGETSLASALYTESESHDISTIEELSTHEDQTQVLRWK